MEASASGRRGRRGPQDAGILGFREDDGSRVFAGEGLENEAWGSMNGSGVRDEIGSAVEAVLLELFVDAAFGQARVPGGLADVAVVEAEDLIEIRPLDAFEDRALDLFERKLLVAGEFAGGRGLALLLDGQVLGQDGGPVGEDEGARTTSLELADIAGPGVAEELAEGIAGDVVDLAVHARPVLADEVLDEKRDVAHALAQGREGDGDDVDAVEQVAAEGARFGSGGQVGVGGGEDANVAGFRLDAAELACTRSFRGRAGA